MKWNRASIQELLKQLQSAHRNKKMLQHQVDQLLRRVYGRRSEKLDPNQLMFDDLILESLDQPLPQPPPEPILEQKAERKKPRAAKRRHPGRIPMPDHPIEKCKGDVGLISHIIVSKFADHLPLYRQDGIFEREGITIPRSTQSSWVLQTCDAIHPLEEELKRAVLERDVLFTDDSIIPLQVKGNGRVKKARLWVYVRGGPGPPLSVFDFSRDRSKKRPLNFLSDYQGYIHADAYSGYDELFKKDRVIEVGCGYTPGASSMKRPLPVPKRPPRSWHASHRCINWKLNGL